MKPAGLMICAMGIPGSGKTSVFHELSHMLNTDAAFFEPEENDSLTPWPKAVSARDEYGYFGSISWFRAMRVPLLYEAKKASTSGKVALVDSYYDKLLNNYLGKDGLDWFFPRDDNYYPVVKAMAEYDYRYLPLADIVVFFNIEHELWNKYCIRRGRNMDKEEKFEEQCFSLQDPMKNACELYSKDFQKKIIFFEQKDLSPIENAKRLKKILGTF